MEVLGKELGFTARHLCVSKVIKVVFVVDLTATCIFNVRSRNKFSTGKHSDVTRL